MDAFVQRMKNAMQRGRSAILPPDEEAAAYVLLPYIMQNQVRPVNELLANSNFNINFKFGRAKRTLLHSAANTGSADCLALLLKKGAVVNIPDKIGGTPLHLAARNGHKKCFYKLVEACADIKAHDNEGLTALHWLACNGRTELLMSILLLGLFVDMEDTHGHTSLHVACQNGHYQCAVQLLKYNANIHKTNRNGGNALYFACRHGQVKCVQLLLDKGSKVKADNDGLSVLEICAQNDYHECALLILLKDLTQLDVLLSLVFSQKLEERKIRNLMENIGKNNTKLLIKIISCLACRTCSSGMELLSISSSYKDLMPQFLRAVRILCVLYNSYMEASSTTSPGHAHGGAHILASPPGSPSTFSSEVEEQHSFRNVHRTGSFNSILDNHATPPRRPHNILRLGHRRSHSGIHNRSASSSGSNSEEIPSNASLVEKRKLSSVSDPFDELETVWGSLRSWFDLVKVELERVQQQQQQQQQHRQELHQQHGQQNLSFQEPEPSPAQSSFSDENQRSHEEFKSHSQIQAYACQLEQNGMEPGSELTQIMIQSSKLAAAIVNSAPVLRREVFLQPSCSIDYLDTSGVYSVDSALKRRTWHVDRVTVRMLSVLGESESSLASLPSFNRSISNDTSNKILTNPAESPLATISISTPNYTSENRVAGVTRPLVAAREVASADEEDSLVEAYADRLCAVTHAFAVCCSTMQKNHGRPGLHPRFSAFIDEYEVVLKVLLARRPQLIFAHFHFLLEHMELLTRFMHVVHAQPFQDRKKWFYENLYDGKPPSMELTFASQQTAIEVDRENIFTTSCQKLLHVSPDILKTVLSIQFIGEAGMGAGVKREWFDTLSREILNPDYALFTQSADGATFQPNSLSDVNPDHLSYFKFAGRMMGLAIQHQQLLNVYFTRSFYKHILGIPVSYRDVESIDPEYANNLQWILDNSIDNLGLELTFSVETDVFGTTTMLELKKDGSSLTVTDANKREYVQLVTEMRMTQAIGMQIRSFQDGFYEIIPHKLISLFDEFELELLISGLPDIDVQDWEKNTEYSFGYDEDNPVIKWFWEIVRNYDKKSLAILLQFVTGSSRVPLGGFTNLVGATGLTKFTITKLDCTQNTRLPMTSTCFNLLKLPEYCSKEILKERLDMALTCGSGIIDIT